MVHRQIRGHPPVKRRRLAATDWEAGAAALDTAQGSVLRPPRRAVRGGSSALLMCARTPFVRAACGVRRGAHSS